MVWAGLSSRSQLPFGSRDSTKHLEFVTTEYQRAEAAVILSGTSNNGTIGQCVIIHLSFGSRNVSKQNKELESRECISLSNVHISLFSSLNPLALGAQAAWTTETEFESSGWLKDVINIVSSRDANFWMAGTFYCDTGTKKPFRLKPCLVFLHSTVNSKHFCHNISVKIACTASVYVRKQVGTYGTGKRKKPECAQNCIKRKCNLGSWDSCTRHWGSNLHKKVSKTQTRKFPSQNVDSALVVVEELLSTFFTSENLSNTFSDLKVSPKRMTWISTREIAMFFLNRKTLVFAKVSGMFGYSTRNRFKSYNWLPGTSHMKGKNIRLCVYDCIDFLHRCNGCANVSICRVNNV